MADIVVPLTYGIAGSQSGLMMRQYKDDSSAAVRERHALILSWLLAVGINLHQRCISRLVGQPITQMLTIPSSGGRQGVHPFFRIASELKAVTASPALSRTGIPVGSREVTIDRFAIEPESSRFDGQHVLLLDDTWTTGSRTQSAVLRLRAAGAEHVSVMVGARWIEPKYADNSAFIASRLTADYDPHICPVTGGVCP
ncbi:phosphoribosyltransferase [Nocardia camponoti]|nr:phosphoribosyltransferase [Nocardia camponoti]